MSSLMSAAPLHGGFIQIRDDVRAALLQGDAIDQLLDRLVGWGMDTLIVQRLAWLGADQARPAVDLTTLPPDSDPPGPAGLPGLGQPRVLRNADHRCTSGLRHRAIEAPGRHHPALGSTGHL